MISHLFEYTLNCSQLFVLHIFWLIKYFNLIKIIVNLLFNYDSIPIILKIKVYLISYYNKFHLT